MKEKKKIVIDIAQIKEVLQRATNFCLNKSAATPGLQGGKISFKKGRIYITATNLNDFFQEAVDLKNNTEEKAIIVDIKKLLELLSVTEEKAAEIIIEETKMKIKTKESVAEFGLLEATDFPAFPEPNGDGEIIEWTGLGDGVKHTTFAASKEAARPALSGIRFARDGKGVVMVATDGFRLSLFRLASPLPLIDVTISAALLNELQKAAPATEGKVVYDGKGGLVGFNTGRFQVITRTIEGDFPAFGKVVPSGFKTRASVSRQDLNKAMKTVSIFNRDSSTTVVFSIQKTQLVIRPRSVQADTVVSSLPVREFEGEEKTIAFNHRFVVDFINNTQSENIILEVNESTSPGVFKLDNNKNFVHIIMPVRVDE